MADFLKQNWGNLEAYSGWSSAWWWMWIAQKAREAAEEARSLARLKSLLEELESARNRVQLVGVLLRDRKWEIVQWLVEEALMTCRSALARWGDHLTESSRNNLAGARDLLRSIAEACVSASVGQLTDDEWHLKAQREAGEFMSPALGQVKGAEERSIRANA